MGEPSRKITEEELERQYTEYRAQFELWKKNNVNSIGTEAYNQYVAQFEHWEKEVAVRKVQVKQARKNHDMEAEAAAYAQSQEAYVSHHLKAMEQAEMHQRAAAAAAAHVAAQQQQHMQQHHMQSMMMRQTAEQAAPSSERDLFLQTMMEGTGGYRRPGDPPLPQLWGNSKTPYDARDPLFAKWGDRAAPTHHKPETNQQVNPVACWMLLDALREKKMVLAPHSSTCPPPPFHGGHGGPPPPIQ